MAALAHAFPAARSDDAFLGRAARVRLQASSPHDAVRSHSLASWCPRAHALSARRGDRRKRRVRRVDGDPRRHRTLRLYRWFSNGRRGPSRRPGYPGQFGRASGRGRRDAPSRREGARPPHCARDRSSGCAPGLERETCVLGARRPHRTWTQWQSASIQGVVRRGLRHLSTTGGGMK
jgi:hypothetical protein